MDKSQTTESIEQKAKELFWAQSISFTGNKWDWNEASEEVKDGFRLHALNETRPLQKEQL